tara:strand:+ start:1205 stop:1534 length:330 start_codon:yes stop_codon:yes gene_type:complete
LARFEIFGLEALNRTDTRRNRDITINDKSLRNVHMVMPPLPAEEEKQPQSISIPLIRADIIAAVKTKNIPLVNKTVPGIQILKIRKIPTKNSVHGKMIAIIPINWSGKS